jgi:hypothetical protein
MLKSELKLIIWITASIVILMIGIYFINFHDCLSPNNTDWGAFGGYLAGTIGITFSLLSVVLIFLTFREQRRQNFENIFQSYVTDYYNLVNLINENWLHRFWPKYLKGREIFGNAIRVIDCNNPKGAFEDIFNCHINVFQHYCNYIIDIYEIVNSFKDFDDKEQENYINRFLSMLSVFELVFFSYYVRFELDKNYKYFEKIKRNLNIKLSQIPIDKALATHKKQIVYISNEFTKVHWG